MREAGRFYLASIIKIVAQTKILVCATIVYFNAHSILVITHAGFGFV